MAEKRFIARRITESDKIRTLANDGKLLATTLYAFLLPYLDKAGRMNANPLLLKGGLFEGYTFTVDELEGAIQDLARVGLIRLYSNGRFGHLIQYDKFHSEDGGFNTPHPKEPESELPAPDDSGSKPVTLPATTLKAAETPSSTRPEHGPEEAGNLPGIVRADVKREIEIKREVKKEHSSTSETENPPPKSLAATPPRESHDPGLFKEIWNTNRGRLPAVHALNNKRKGQIRALVKEHGSAAAADLFRDATRAVAADEFWITRQYGFDNLLTGKVLQKAEQWRAGAIQLGTGNAKLATTALTIANAIGGLDDQPN